MRATRLAATRLALLAITGAAAVSVAGCGTGDGAAPGQPAGQTSAVQGQPPPEPGPGGANRVTGLIASVTADTLQVTGQGGTTAVGFTASTKINELTPAGLRDITAGSCVGVKPANNSPQSPTTVTAEGVRITEAVDGRCQGPRQPPAGEAPPGGPGGPPPGPPVLGAVTSVAGNAITITTADGAATTVTVTDQTHISKESAATAQAISAGKCVIAEGTPGDGGSLRATDIMLRPAVNGNCAGGGARPQGH